MFVLGGRLGIIREQFLKLFSPIRTIEKRDQITSSNTNEYLRQPNAFNLQNYFRAKQHIHELKVQNAILTHELLQKNLF